MTKENLKIVFFGTPDFAVASLDKLIENGFNISAVVTMPDKQAGRGHHLLQSDVKKYALNKGLKILQPVKLKDPEFVTELQAINADLFIVIAFRMLPEVVWGMPKLGTFNLHASLLPKYRGAAPINWAVINGEKETGVTTFFLKHEIDTGDIIEQRKIDIDIKDDVEIVHDKLMNLGADMVIHTVNSIIDGTLKTVPQDKLIAQTEMLPAPKIFKETCQINWDNTAMNLYNFVRGLSPYPAAWTSFEKDGKEFQLKIFTTSLTDKSSDGITPGSVLENKGKLYVATHDYFIEILSLQLSGKKRMDTDSFLRGFSLEKICFK